MNLFRRNSTERTEDASYTVVPSEPSNVGTHRKPKTFFFGGLELPYKAATQHNALIGSTGSGKTLQLRMTLLSVLLPALRERRDARFIVADVKQEEIKFLTSRGVPKEQLIISNPFDARCAGWDIWRDVRSRDVGLQIASLLIPESNDVNRYFSDAARDLLYAVISLFIDRGAEWQLSDLLVAFSSLKMLTHILSHAEETLELLDNYIGASAETAMSIFTNARSQLAKFEAAAALWRQAKKRFSLEEFLKERGQALLLGNHQPATYAVGALNRLMLQRLTELSLGLPDVDEAEDDPYRAFYLLDEIHRIGAGKKLDFMPDLLTGGRSKGVSCTYATQGRESLLCVYSEHETETLLSMAGNIGVLRVSGTQTPDWSSKLFGEQEIVERFESGSTAHAEHTTHTHGWSESIRQTPLFLPGFFRTLPSPEPGKPLSGVFSCSCLGARPYVMALASQEAKERLEETLNPFISETKDAQGEPNFVPWADASKMKLERWNNDDYIRLKLNPLPEKTGLDAL